jgi:hypothetical protein
VAIKQTWGDTGTQAGGITSVLERSAEASFGFSIAKGAAPGYDPVKSPTVYFH